MSRRPQHQDNSAQLMLADDAFSQRVTFRRQIIDIGRGRSRPIEIYDLYAHTAPPVCIEQLQRLTRARGPLKKAHTVPPFAINDFNGLLDRERMRLVAVL